MIENPHKEMTNVGLGHSCADQLLWELEVCSSNPVIGKVEAQLVEWSLLTPEVCSSNPVIGNFYIEQLTVIFIITKFQKEAGNGPFKIVRAGVGALLPTSKDRSSYPITGYCFKTFS